MHCPRCGSHDVVRKPGNQISHDQGYRCYGCESNLRSPGSLWLLLVILLIGLSFGVGLTCLFFMTDLRAEHRPVRMVWYALIGYTVAGYAIAQLCRPVARPNADD